MRNCIGRVGVVVAIMLVACGGGRAELTGDLADSGGSTGARGNVPHTGGRLDGPPVAGGGWWIGTGGLQGTGAGGVFPATGGRMPTTGGVPPTGGRATGGVPTGGVPTGGVPTGGALTGGVDPGGFAGTGGATGGAAGEPVQGGHPNGGAPPQAGTAGQAGAFPSVVCEPLDVCSCDQDCQLACEGGCELGCDQSNCELACTGGSCQSDCADASCVLDCGGGCSDTCVELDLHYPVWRRLRPRLHALDLLHALLSRRDQRRRMPAELCRGLTVLDIDLQRWVPAELRRLDL